MENGLFLGFFPGAEYTSAEASFGEGDWLLLYTDGITETAGPADDQFGQDGLRNFLDRYPDRSAGDFADALLEELASWSGRGAGQEGDDDATVVAARWSPPARR